MKTISNFGIAKSQGSLRHAACACIGLLGASLVYSTPANAADADKKNDGDFNNVVEITAGGFSVGKTGQPAFQHYAQTGGVGEFYAGIQNLHMEKDITKTLSATLDGRSLVDINDHDWTLSLTDSRYGYVKGGYNEYQTWYDGNGGYYPAATSNGNTYTPAPGRTSIAPQESIYAVDRGSVWMEAGLRMDKLPEVTFRAEHDWRRGDKDSTSWGDVTNALYSSGPAPASGNYAVRKISPTFLQLDETRDIWSLDLTHTLGKTDFGLGLRYEHFMSNDYRQENLNPENAVNPTSSQATVGTTGAGTASKSHTYITDNEGYKGDIFNAHAFTQTHINDKLSFSTGYAYTQSDTDVMGSRLAEQNYNMLPYTGASSTFVNLAGENLYRDMVLNLNLNWKPIKDLSITPSLRAERETINGLDQSQSYPTPPTAVVTTANANKSVTKYLTEGLDIQYTGLNNLVLYAEGEWSQDDSRFAQWSKANTVGSNYSYYMYNDDLDNDKYTVGANWYPLSNLSLSAQGYHKDRHDNPSPQSILSGATQLNQNYSSYLLAQDTSTNGANVRVTWRALKNVTLVTRYDWIQSSYSATTHAGYPASPLDSENISRVTSQILSESLTWCATDRLYFQGSAHYSKSLTDLAGAIANTNGTTGNAIVADFRNDYWDGVIAAGYQINDKTNVEASYTCYHANNQGGNPQYLAFGAHGNMEVFTIGLNRQINPNLKWGLKYGYFTSRDKTTGGLNDYDANVISTNLQYRF